MRPTVKALFRRLSTSVVIIAFVAGLPGLADAQALRVGPGEHGEPPRSVPGPEGLLAATAGTPPDDRLIRIRRRLAAQPHEASLVLDASALPLTTWRSARGFQEAAAPQAEPPQGTPSSTGPIIATVLGAALFGYFLARGSGEAEDQVAARETKDELVDFTLFAVSVTLLGTGTFMLVAGQ